MFLSLFLLVGIVVLAMIANSRAKNQQWQYRPYRLCMNCFTVAQPFLRGNNENYCPACQRVDPVPLDSPGATEYFRSRGQVGPAQPVPPKLTAEQQRWKVIATAVILLVLAGAGGLIDYLSSRDDHAAATTTAVAPTAASKVYTVDEYAALKQACGNPGFWTDKVQPEAVGGKGGVQRDVKYRRAEFFFLRNNESPVWTLTGAFPIHGDDTLDHEQATKLMPCLSKVHFQVALRDDQ
jgi:hypothetical protein